MKHFIAHFIAIVALTMVLLIDHAYPRDLGQWTNSPDADWYRSLMQPDVPTASCCGEADAYFCNNYRSHQDGTALCTIDDDRPDEPRHRPHIDNGTVIVIPQNKLKWDSGNPTGNGVVFLSRQGYVFCYVQPGGA